MNGWKFATIILIIFNLMTISFLAYSYKLGTDMINNDSKCAYDICESYESYYYDTETKVCYCFEDTSIASEGYDYSKFLG